MNLSQAQLDRRRTNCRQWRARHKHEPEYKAKKHAGDNAFRLRMRDDPELKARRLATTRKWVDKPENAATMRAAIRKFRQEHPEMVRAHDAVKYALRVGKLVRPVVCSSCGLPPRPRRDGLSGLHAHHHHGYENKLDVQWLCIDCHKRLHRKIA